MSELGYIALLLAFAASIYALVASALGARGGYAELSASARNGVLAVCGLVSLAALVLFYALLTHDFSLEYVASYTSRDMDPVYVFSAFWAGNAGSLLFWAWSVSGFAAVVILQHWRRLGAFIAYVSAILMGIVALFLGVMILLSNPFLKLASTPPDGRGLNPLLENMGMFFHPPTTLLGYAGFAIPFAFAMAALITNRSGDDWIRLTRRWTLFAWFILGAGNLFGAQWAYVELGWGGYWAWDPVENASFMPWLVGTAFLHSVMIQKRRGMLKVWNMVLLIITFELTIFGTFLTRSGVLSSVHSFSESGMGPFFFSFIVVSTLAAVLLLLFRVRQLRSENELDSLVSRESTFLLNNLVLMAVAFATLWGTIFPLISEWVRGVKITVSVPFFNQVNGPILLLLILLMGICPLIGWRRASVDNFMRNFLYPLALGLVAAVGMWLIGIRQPFALLSLSIVAFVVATIFLEWFRGVRTRARLRGENPLKAFLNVTWANKPRYGGYIIHLSILMIAIGVIGSSFYKSEKEATLLPGQTMSLGSYTMKYEGKSEFNTPSRNVTVATLSLYNSDNKPIGFLNAKKFFHRYYDQPVTEVAIYTTPLEDFYVILGAWGEDGSTVFKVVINPMVVWIWIGGVLALVGTVVAFWPDRRERLTEEVDDAQV